jgi:4-diphosphocytidyl-2-C-methyl-D-erythritol kinase
MAVERFAPAKVNLFLHVGPVGDDGYHPLASLVTFADVGDVVRLEASETMAWQVTGPFAHELGADSDNLVLEARDLLLAQLETQPRAFRLTLDKRLPIASGLGGGSADAAAALWLVGARVGLVTSDSADERWLAKLAAGLGADVPMCLVGRPRLAEGRGDVLTAPPCFPALHAVLVNPLQPSPTGAVYRAYDAAGAPGGAEAPVWPDAMDAVDDVVRFLAACRNDLEAPALALQPAIGEVLGILRARPEALFARMSGSGATCFALCRDARDRRDLAFAVSAQRPDWWVRDCTLAGFEP